MNPIQYCPLCGLGDQKVEESDHGERLNVRCRRCGRFEISRGAAGWATKNDCVSQLSAWIRNRNESSNVRPEITRANVEDIVSEVPKFSVSDKQRIILSLLERKTALPGDEVEFTFEMVMEGIHLWKHQTQFTSPSRQKGHLALTITDGDYPCQQSHRSTIDSAIGRARLLFPPGTDEGALNNA